MTKARNLDALTTLSRMLLDLRLEDLRQAAAAREKCQAQLRDLDVQLPQSGTLAGAAAEIAALTYQRWADVRRQELNRALARHSAAWLEAGDAARLAFGKDRSLTELLARQTATDRRSKPD